MEKSDIGSEKLQQAVEWKIFELQCSLIDADATRDLEIDSVSEFGTYNHLEHSKSSGYYSIPDSLFKDCLAWFQGRHYEEVVEERTNEAKCGFPGCRRSSRPSNTVSKFRVDLRSKKIFETDFSKRFCSDQCFEASSGIRAKFSETPPYSREIAQTLNLADSVNGDIDDLLQLLSDRGDTSMPGSIGITDVSSIPPFANNRINKETGNFTAPIDFVEGLPSTKYPAGTIPSASESLAMNKLVRVRHSSERKDLCRNVGVVVPATERGVNINDIFDTMKEIQKRRENVDISNREQKCEEANIAEYPLKQISADSRTAMWGSKKLKHQHASTQRSVSWSDNPVDATKNPNKSDRSVLSAKVNKPNPSAVPSAEPVQSENRSIRSNRLAVSERILPSVMPESFLLSKGRCAEPNRCEETNANIDCPPKSATNSEKACSADGDDRVDESTSTVSIHIAPSTALRDLSYNPFTLTQYRDSQGTDLHNDEYEEEEQKSLASDSKESGFEEESGLLVNCSLFLCLWLMMDDLFGRISLASIFTPDRGDTWDTHSTLPLQHSGSSTSVHLQQLQQTRMRLIERGLATAERTLDIDRHILQGEERRRFYSAKSQLVAKVAQSSSDWSEFTLATGADRLIGSSRFWQLVGVLVVDALVQKLRSKPVGMALDRQTASEDSTCTKQVVQDASNSSESGAGISAFRRWLESEHDNNSFATCRNGISSDAKVEACTAATGMEVAESPLRNNRFWDKIVENSLISLSNQLAQTADKNPAPGKKEIVRSTVLRDADLRALRSYFNYC